MKFSIFIIALCLGASAWGAELSIKWEGNYAIIHNIPYAPYSNEYQSLVRHMKDLGMIDKLQDIQICKDGSWVIKFKHEFIIKFRMSDQEYAILFR